MDVSPRQDPAYRLSLASITMKRRIWWGILIVYAGAIFALSHTPVAAGELPFPHFDKCVHAAEFALFFALAWKALRRRALSAFLLTAFYAGTDELHQLFVATRTASALDWIADLIGAAIALALLLLGPRLLGFLRHRILDRNHSKAEF